MVISSTLLKMLEKINLWTSQLIKRKFNLEILNLGYTNQRPILESLKKSPSGG
jgi:hypothetical protein